MKPNKKELAVWVPGDEDENGYYMHYNDIRDAVVDNEAKDDPVVEVYECTYKLLGKYKTSEKVVKVRG